MNMDLAPHPDIKDGEFVQFHSNFGDVFYEVITAFGYREPSGQMLDLPRYSKYGVRGKNELKFTRRQNSLSGKYDWEVRKVATREQIIELQKKQSLILHLADGRYINWHGTWKDGVLVSQSREL